MDRLRCLATAFGFGRLFFLIAGVFAAAAFTPPAQAGAKRKPSVLIVNTLPAFFLDVQSQVRSSGLFAAVDLFNGAAGTPSVASLKAYDAVLVASDNNFSDPVALGNNLADYVDAGGGVVNAAYSVGTFSPPAGRWNPGYLCMSPGAGLATTGASLDLSSITDPNHAILIGVGALSTSFGYRINQNAVVAGATVVARWTGGNVLVAAGPLPGRVDLNLNLLSTDALFGGWNPATDDGVKLIVNSLLYVMRPKVLLVHADSDLNSADVQSKIRGRGALGPVDRFDARFGTPTLTQLQNYDAVMTWSNYNYSNSDALGNVLADYVDAGGGVVCAAYAHADTSPNRRLGGRWISGNYEIIPAGSGAMNGTSTLGAVAYASHPIMNGVLTINGGTGSPRPFTKAIKPGGLIVAKWSDDRTLAAVSKALPNRADLGLFPPSSTIGGASWWQVGSDGDKLMSNALMYTIRPYVATVAAESFALSDLSSKLAASRRFSGVAALDARTGTPDPETFAPFSALATWSHYRYADTNAIGNWLADYVDAGGGVVAAKYAITDFCFPEGRWKTQGYEIVPAPLPHPEFIPEQLLGTVLEPNHPIASFVRKLQISPSDSNPTPPLRGRTILTANDGGMLAAVHNFKKRADLGYWPVSSSFDGGWNRHTDGAWLAANALEFVVRVKPCPGDFNGDGQVDDTDFVLFIARYDSLLDPRADLTGDGNTDDADFSIFVVAYNELICP
ncbi:MAG: hypothetical protein JSS51_05630 [Planctomycetes bacterium]|nr:hypothetical protein [Planctomycetota bacterium]